MSPPRAAKPKWDVEFNHGSSPRFITCTSAQVRIFPTDDNLKSVWTNNPLIMTWPKFGACSPFYRHLSLIAVLSWYNWWNMFLWLLVLYRKIFLQVTLICNEFDYNRETVCWSASNALCCSEHVMLLNPLFLVCLLWRQRELRGSLFGNSCRVSRAICSLKRQYWNKALKIFCPLKSGAQMKEPVS